MKLRYYHKLFFISLLVWGFTDLFAQTPGVAVLSEDHSETPSNQKAVRYIGYDVQDSLITTSSIATIKGTDLQKTFNVNLANKLFG
ncbi:MAG: hypothetical protein H7Y07_00545, partial [Pyrinomonadaceae bacterium]|nr:hypothetical protein [Sphingobacteriaceae bacterium]